MNRRQYYVYIMSNPRHTIYTGVTGNLEQRVWQHKRHVDPLSFTTRYSCTSLVYYEDTDDVWVAIEREKAIKGMTRVKKIALIRAMNPDWRDLSEDWQDSLTDRRVPDSSLRSE
jgi:putative endonuclease